MNDKNTELQKRGRDEAEKMRDRTPTVTPAVDIFENKDEVLILADLPGVERGDLAIHLEKNQLTIEARRLFSSETPASDQALDYRRAFVVPQGIDAEKISAELALGVLSLRLPKSAALKPRQIAVKAG
jgi:HSP20 family molecular chaperone IbpA